MKIQVVSNCGVVLSDGNGCLLIDALNQSYDGYKGIDSETAEKIIAGEGIYARVHALLYTHLHPDHYDSELNRRFLTRHTGTMLLAPESGLPYYGELADENFQVRFIRARHIGLQFREEVHYAIWLDFAGSSFFFSGDADPTCLSHASFHNLTKPDWAFINPLFINLQTGREFLSDVGARRVCVYHLPEYGNGSNGMSRKLQVSLKRNFFQFPVFTAEHYPLTLPGLEEGSLS